MPQERQPERGALAARPPPRVRPLPRLHLRARFLQTRQLRDDALRGGRSKCLSHGLLASASTSAAPTTAAASATTLAIPTRGAAATAPRRSPLFTRGLRFKLGFEAAGASGSCDSTRGAQIQYELALPGCSELAPHRNKPAAVAEAPPDFPAPELSSCGAVIDLSSIYACSGL